MYLREREPTLNLDWPNALSNKKRERRLSELLMVLMKNWQWETCSGNAQPSNTSKNGPWTADTSLIQLDFNSVRECSEALALSSELSQVVNSDSTLPGRVKGHTASQYTNVAGNALKKWSGWCGEGSWSSLSGRSAECWGRIPRRENWFSLNEQVDVPGVCESDILYVDTWEFSDFWTDNTWVMFWLSTCLRVLYPLHTIQHLPHVPTSCHSYLILTV
jgi:hypothetical protein